MEEIPITDNHIHVDPVNGEGPLKVAQKFHASGGRVMIIPNKPSWSCGKPFNYEHAMDLVLEYVDIINHNTPVKAYAVLGLHPAELSRLLESGKSPQEAETLIIEGMEYAQKKVQEEEAVALGEIGRPHYEVSREEWELHNRIMVQVMQLAKEADCPVQLHTESSQEPQFNEFSQMADKAGLKRHKLIKHFSGPYTSREENHGLTPSLIATREVVSEGIKKGNNFLMETDYLDDVTRPGAVLGPKTVPRRTFEFIKKGIITTEDAFGIHKDNVKRVYGIDNEL
ncbi:MAG: deoxyribonuclease [Methanobacterium sp.]|nr:MAG: deoxyribonuclease [Methanobacterium sp.]